MALRLPEIVPIQPLAGPMPQDQDGWLFDMKYDGYRGVFFLDDDYCRVLSKKSKRLYSFEPLCWKVGKALGVKSAILDGEMVVRDKSGRPIFEDLHRRRKEPMYIAFDLLWLNGKDMRGWPLRDRRKKLEELVPEKGDIVTYSFALEGRGTALFEAVQKSDLEGVVAKRLADPYARWVKWLKIKNPNYSQEVGRESLFGQRRPYATGRPST